MDGPKANGQIKADPIRLIDQDGNMIGVTPLREALNMASELDMDLVEISPNAEPPVCKIMDIGKYMYEQQKKKKEAKKHQKIVHLKEIKLRYNTTPHDLEYRIEHAKEFLGEGDKVKFSMKFKGRENAHLDMGYKRFEEIIEALKEVGKAEGTPRMEAGSLTLFFSPIAAVVK